MCLISFMGSIIFRWLNHEDKRMPISNKSIGERIAKARKTARMTQAELSEKIEISEKYLSRIECGKQLPSIVIVVKICNILCVSMDELLGQTNIYNNKSIQDEISALSAYEQKRIAEIIKIIREIKNNN